MHDGIMGGCGGACACGTSGGKNGGHHGWHMKRAFMALALLALAVWLGFKARNEWKQFDYIGVPIERNVISVSGEGKVVGIPDVATIDLGMTVERKTVADAQKENTRVMNELIAALKDSGVDKKDLQTTAYNVYPNYDWKDNKQTLRGYTVSQNVHVKVRNLDGVSDILGKAGELGANQIGGIQFTVDEPEKLKAEARQKALENAKEKARDLAAIAGVKLRRVVNFSESQSGGYPQPVFLEKAYGMGGDGAAPPSVEAGSSEITVNVSLTYEIE
jgi:uncharacterized protein YggE